MQQNIALSIQDVQAATRLGRTKIYSMLKTGELRGVKVGKRTLVLKADLEDFLNNLESYPAKTGQQSHGVGHG